MLVLAAAFRGVGLRAARLSNLVVSCCRAALGLSPPPPPSLGPAACRSALFWLGAGRCGLFWLGAGRGVLPGPAPASSPCAADGPKHGPTAPATPKGAAGRAGGLCWSSGPPLWLGACRGEGDGAERDGCAARSALAVFEYPISLFDFTYNSLLIQLRCMRSPRRNARKLRKTLQISTVWDIIDSTTGQNRLSCIVEGGDTRIQDPHGRMGRGQHVYVLLSASS